MYNAIIAYCLKIYYTYSKETTPSIEEKEIVTLWILWPTSWHATTKKKKFLEIFNKSSLWKGNLLAYASSTILLSDLPLLPSPGRSKLA